MSESEFFRVRPDASEPGMRLRLERNEGDIAMLVEERVLPERVLVRAHRSERIEFIWLTREDIAWLHDATGELLEQWPVGT